MIIPLPLVPQPPLACDYCNWYGEDTVYFDQGEDKDAYSVEVPKGVVGVQKVAEQWCWLIDLDKIELKPWSTDNI